MGGSQPDCNQAGFRTEPTDRSGEVPQAAGIVRGARHLQSPPGTIMCRCGWCVIAEPQVWSTDVKPIRTPRRLRSAAIVHIVCEEALNKRS